jgi:hypothetical protein
MVIYIIIILVSSYYFDCSVLQLSSDVVVELRSLIVVRRACLCSPFVFLVGRLHCSEVGCCYPYIVIFNSLKMLVKLYRLMMVLGAEICSAL